MKIWSTSKLACTQSTTDETFAHTLATFSTFVPKLSSGNTCVTLTGNKPQPSLGNHPCSTNAKLTSLPIFPSLYWPPQEQLWGQIKDTFPIHTQSNLIKQLSTYCRIATKNTLCIDHILRNGEETACWGEREVLGMWHPALPRLNCKMGRSMKLAKEV